MKKHGKLRVASAALAVTLTAAALLPGLTGTDVSRGDTVADRRA